MHLPAMANLSIANAQLQLPSYKEYSQSWKSIQLAILFTAPISITNLQDHVILDVQLAIILTIQFQLPLKEDKFCVTVKLHQNYLIPKYPLFIGSTAWLYFFLSVADFGRRGQGLYSPLPPCNLKEYIQKTQCVNIKIQHFNSYIKCHFLI